MGVVKLTIFLGIGIALCCSGIFIAISRSDILDFLVNSKLKFSPTSPMFLKWLNPPVPVYWHFHFFNWTNPENITVADSKPVVEELGAVVFREENVKENVTWNEDGTITYLKRRWWYFEPEMSNGSLDDLVTIPNPIALALSNKVRNSGYWSKKAVSLTFTGTGQEISVTKTIGQLLFEGYEDPIFTLKDKVGSIMGSSDGMNKFGFYYGQNDSTKMEGVTTIESGQFDLSRKGKLVEWNYSNRTAFEEHCGDITGAATEVFPPLPNREKGILLFSTSVCRTLHLSYVSDSMLYNIPTVTFTAGPDVFDNGTFYPENECFCEEETCLPSGVMDASKCMKGLPSYLSLPHFYLADPSFKESVDGIEPDPIKHSLNAIIEPVTGTGLDIEAKLQLNLMIRHHKYISLFKEIKEPTLIPVFWTKRSFIVPESLTFLLKILLSMKLICIGVALVLITIGLSLIVISITIHLRRKRIEKSKDIDKKDNKYNEMIMNDSFQPLMKNGKEQPS